MLTACLSCLSLRKKCGNGGNRRLCLVLRLLCGRRNFGGGLRAGTVQDALADLPDDEDDDHEDYQQAECRADAQSGQYSRRLKEVRVQVAQLTLLRIEAG